MKQEKASSTTSGHYQLPYNFGLGGVPLGNEFTAVVESMKAKIPTDFWAELKAEKLISEGAPVK